MNQEEAKGVTNLTWEVRPKFSALVAERTQEKGQVMERGRPMKYIILGCYQATEEKQSWEILSLLMRMDGRLGTSAA